MAIKILPAHLSTDPVCLAPLAWPLHFWPGGRKPLRHFSGNAQEDNTGGFTGWPFWSRSTPLEAFFGDCPERTTEMLGRLMIEPVVRVDPTIDLQTAVATLIKVTDNVEIVRWIELPASVLLFLLVPGDRESGAVYFLDSKNGAWYAIDFDDKQFGGYRVSQLETLLKDCDFLDLIERPGLWRTGLRWVVMPGMRPEAAV